MEKIFLSLPENPVKKNFPGIPKGLNTVHLCGEGLPLFKVTYMQKCSMILPIIPDQIEMSTQMR